MSVFLRVFDFGLRCTNRFLRRFRMSKVEWRQKKWRQKNEGKKTTGELSASYFGATTKWPIVLLLLLLRSLSVSACFFLSLSPLLRFFLKSNTLTHFSGTELDDRQLFCETAKCKIENKRYDIREKKCALNSPFLDCSTTGRAIAGTVRATVSA